MRTNVGRKAISDCINISELQEWIKKDINRLAGIKCQALISLKNNVSVNDICKVLGVSRESIRLWRKTIEKEGPDGFIIHPKTGRKKGLTEDIKTLLKTVIIESPEKYKFKQTVWDGKLVCKIIKEKMNIEISVRTAQYWLKAIGFTRQRPRKKYKQSNKEEIEAFKKS
jgi:transposase